jgi:hypothetical protein
MAKIKFTGQCLAQNTFTSKKTGLQSIGLLFLDQGTQRQFQVSGNVAVDQKNMFSPMEWELDVQLQGGDFGKPMFAKVTEIAGKAK